VLVNVLLAIVAFFGILLLVKKVFGIKFCVLCVSVSLTWIGLFVLAKLNRFTDLPLLALLLGESVTGIYYYTQRHIAKELRIFTLPFFLSLTTLAYYLVNPLSNVLLILSVLFGLWITTWVLFIYRNDPGKRSLVENVMDCCNEK